MQKVEAERERKPNTHSHTDGSKVEWSALEVEWGGQEWSAGDSTNVPCL